MHQTKHSNNGTMTSLSGRKKINKQIKLIKRMPPDMNSRNILANMNVKLY